MRMKNNHVHWLVLVFPLIIWGCSTSENLAVEEAMKAYGNDRLEIRPEFKVFHQSDDSTAFYVKFDTKDLAFRKTDEGKYRANLEIHLEIDAEGDAANFSNKKREIAVPPIPRSAQGKSILAKTVIALPSDLDYSVLLNIVDELSGKRFSKRLYVKKSNLQNRLNFIARPEGSQTTLLTDRIAPDETYEIELREGNYESVFVSYYDRSFSLPAPPFAYFDPGPVKFEPDNMFSLPVENGSVKFTSDDAGFYHFRIDSNSTRGFTLFVSSEEFPEVKKVKNMLDPFRYLVSGKEYKSILDAPDRKAAIENFWVEWSGSKNRARSAIQSYYTRVELANRFFSSHLEGWKSDRGLIFTVYGPPDKIYKTEESETWIYGEEDNPMSITFKFRKFPSPFTDNDYRLSRQDYYKPSWYQRIEAWRNGRIY